MLERPFVGEADCWRGLGKKRASHTASKCTTRMRRSISQQVCVKLKAPLFSEDMQRFQTSSYVLYEVQRVQRKVEAQQGLQRLSTFSCEGDQPPRASAALACDCRRARSEELHRASGKPHQRARPMPWSIARGSFRQRGPSVSCNESHSPGRWTVASSSSSYRYQMTQGRSVAVGRAQSVASASRARRAEPVGKLPPRSDSSAMRSRHSPAVQGRRAEAGCALTALGEKTRTGLQRGLRTFYRRTPLSTCVSGTWTRCRI